MRVAYGVLIAAVPALSGCGGMLGGSDGPEAAPIAPQTDPTPLAKCKVAADAANPLVTEWPASEKAHLQSLASTQTVAVEYAGCELRVIDACRLDGQYVWRPTTVATDTVEITNADELFAKLPIGAFALEGELQRSGKLAVQTTVSGQMRGEGMPEVAPATGACAEATHYVSAISVGAFKLLSGSDVSGGGQVGIGGVGAGGQRQRKKVVLREAGVQGTCAQSTEEAPHTQCGSPIQVFLQPLRQPSPVPGQPPVVPVSPEQQAKAEGGIHIAFQSPDEDETWTLRDGRSNVLCTVPCSAWVPPVSGYFLQRERPDKKAIVRLPASFPHRPGARVDAEFQNGRGSPFLSKVTFYFGGIPLGAAGAGFTAWGIAQTTGAGCSKDADGKRDCPFGPGVLIPYGVILMGLSVASLWWFLHSQDEKVETFEQLPAPVAKRKSRVEIMLGPGGVAGTF